MSFSGFGTGVLNFDLPRRLDDLNTFEKAGIIPPARMKDVAAVRKMLLGK